MNPPKHPALRTLQGNPGKRPIPVMPKLPAGEHAPPPWLKAEGDIVALSYWAEHVPMLMQAEIMTNADRQAFAQACTYWSIMRSEAKWGRKQVAFGAWLRIIQDFGLTPGQRVRLAKPKKASESPGTRWGAAL